jgi:hypothetical protein
MLLQQNITGNVPGNLQIQLNPDYTMVAPVFAVIPSVLVMPVQTAVTPVCHKPSLPVTITMHVIGLSPAHSSMSRLMVMMMVVVMAIFC